MSAAEIERCGTAGARYKEITAAATGAVERMRQYEHERVAELTETVARAETEMSEAATRRDEIREAVEFRWASVQKALFNERWLTVGRCPEPDTDARGAVAEHRTAMQRAFVALHEAITTSRWRKNG